MFYHDALSGGSCLLIETEVNHNGVELTPRFQYLLDFVQFTFMCSETPQSVAGQLRSYNERYRPYDMLTDLEYSLVLKLQKKRHHNLTDYKFAGDGSLVFNLPLL